MISSDSKRRVGIIGHRGFIGSAVVSALRSTGCEIVEIRHVDLDGVPDLGDTRASAADWWSESGDAIGELRSAVSGLDVLINAAGAALPDSIDTSRLWRSNTLLPVILADAVEKSPDCKFLHVSSAAVQGRCLTLTESRDMNPFSFYSRSKAEAERLLFSMPIADTNQLIIYRPTSVHGLKRPSTERLVRYFRSPLVPLLGDGTQPMPTALIQNVSAAVAHLTKPSIQGGIFLHPSEGVSLRVLHECFGTVPLVRVPRSIVRLALPGISTLTRVNRLSGLARRVELLAQGQNIEATALYDSGFTLPSGHDGYVDLRQSVDQKRKGRKA